MSYFAAGAWWSSSGVPYSSQAEADAAEKSGQDVGRNTDSAFAQAMGRTTAPRAPAGAPTAQQSADAIAAAKATQQAGTSTQRQYDPAVSARAVAASPAATGALAARAVSDQQQASAAASQRSGGFLGDLGRLGLYGATGGPITGAASAYTPPVARDVAFAPQNFLDEVGDQVIPGGSGVQGGNLVPGVRRTGDQFFPSETLQSGGPAQGYQGVTNSGNTGFVSGLIDGVPGYPAGRLVANAAGSLGGGGARATNAPSYQPAPLPQPSMTPQSIMAQNTNTVRPSSAQQDSIVNQMIAQSQVQSGYQDFNSPQYDQSRSAAMGYTQQLAGQANNNVAITGLDAGRYDQSRGTMNQITGQLQGQANNDVGDIQADSAQRDQSRNQVMGTAGLLTSNADNNVARINADPGYRNASAGTVQGFEDRLKAVNNVDDIRANQENYTAQTSRQMGIIDQLVAMAQAQEGPSAAESLMLNAQERAVRNAYGDAGSLGGGWRSQVTGQRRALGQAASQQADIAAQIGALRANEAATFRGQSMGALGQAGSLQGDIAGRDASLAQSDAALLAQIRQGNQANTRESAAIGGNLALGRMGLDQGLAISDADRAMLAAQGNQQNRLNSLLGAGNLQTGAMQSDTSLAQSNASLLAQIRQGNQANSLAALAAAGQNAGTTLNADLGFATNDASIRTQRELANQANALAALQGAANAANNTAGLDANIGINNSNNRVTVDQNNRANSIAALQNAGVLSSNTRAQDVQLSVQDSQALTQRISAAASLSGTVYASQLQSIGATADRDQRQRQWEAMQARMPPAELQRLIATAGPALGLMGLFV
jgi:hypothetical protein